MCSSDPNYEFNDHWIGLMRGWIDDCNCADTTLLPSECDACRLTFAWSDDTDMVYTSGWSDFTEPLGLDCVRLQASGWSAENCETFLKYICERG